MSPTRARPPRLPRPARLTGLAARLVLAPVLALAGAACTGPAAGPAATTARAGAGTPPASATGGPGSTGRASTGPASTGRASTGRASTGAPPGAGPPPGASGAPAAGPTGQPVASRIAVRVGSVLAGLTRGPVPNPAAVAKAVAALVPGPVLGRRIGVLVLDPYTGARVLTRLATVPLTPASTSKLLTATALVDRYGSGHRFATRVVLQPATSPTGAGTVPAHPAQLVLVGGGDPSLTAAAAGPPGPVPAWSTAVRGPARLPALAAATAAALRRRGLATVRLSVDDTLFTGPRVDPAWPRTDVGEGFVGPVDCLTVDNGRVGPGSGSRVPDPARTAGTDLAALLRADGIAVVGPVLRTTAAPGAAPVAAVDSPPVAELVRHLLENSDNDYAEVLARQVAVGGPQPASFAGAVTAVDDRLGTLGVDLAGSRRFDGSGLSHADRIEPATLASVVSLDLRTPRLGAVLRGAAVAGRPGSLLYRMGGAHGPAAGRIVAKTGTLTRVHDLAGYVIPAGGRPLVFVFMVDTAHDDLAAEALLDAAAVRLARSGSVSVTRRTP